MQVYDEYGLPIYDDIDGCFGNFIIGVLVVLVLLILAYGAYSINNHTTPPPIYQQYQQCMSVTHDKQFCLTAMKTDNLANM